MACMMFAAWERKKVVVLEVVVGIIIKLSKGLNL